MAGEAHRALRLLVVLAALDGLVAVALSGGAVRRVASGTTNGLDYLATAGLAVPAALLATALVAVHEVNRLVRQLAHREHQLAARSQGWTWEATPELVAISCNAAVAEVLGYRREDVIGRSVFDALHDEDLPAARALLAGSVRDGTGWDDVELRWRHATGRVVVLQCSASPLLDPVGRLIGFRGSCRPILGDSSTARRLEGIAHRTRGVLEHRTVGIALQPIMDLAEGTWIGVEALARFPDNAAPERWFNDAHEAGLGVALELLALEAAVAAVHDLPAPVYVSVNASPALVLDPAFDRVLRQPGLPLDRVVIEITEHAAVTRYDDIRAALLPHRERGLRLAVDDTGAGYASFNHVLRLRPDIIKLDRSLLADIDRDGACRAFVTAIVMLALELQATVTAEGVQTPRELDLLRSLGVDAAQGYLLARPSLDRGKLAAWRTRDWFAHAGLASTLRPVDLRTTQWANADAPATAPLLE